MGNRRSWSVLINSTPTAPVAPTIATWYCFGMGAGISNEPDIESNRGIVEHPFALRIVVHRQELEVRHGGEIRAIFPVSTSKFGIGFEEGSFQTPTGRFVIADKIGDGAPLGAIFRGRIPTGEVFSGESADDLILTRILRLAGRDPENLNTWDRYIYIHGTNQEDAIGTPASHGCVRMRNADIVSLFPMVPIETPVSILA